MPLDAQTKLMLDAMAQLDLPDITTVPIAEGRARYTRATDPAAGQPVDHVADHTINEHVTVRSYRHGSDTAQPLIVFFHGGGWVLGNFDTHDAVCRHLCRDVGAVVVAVDYRLAPETPFPGAVDDSFAGLQWAIANASELGADPTRVAVAGDSAGGNLAAVVALQARDAGIELKHQALIYPVTDAEFDRQSYLDNAEGYMLTRSTMRWFWDMYVPDIDMRENWRAAPIYADLAGVCPATVITAEFDPLRDEGAEYAKALRAAGVDAHHEQYDGLIHGFYGNHMIVHRALDAHASVAGALKQALR